MKKAHKIRALAGLAMVAMAEPTILDDTKKKYPSIGGFSRKRKLKPSAAKRRKQAKRSENKARNKKH